jgi:transposase
MEGIILENVRPGATITTDEHPSDGDLKRTYTHEAVNHSIKEYVRGKHHTNSLEGYWSH